MIYAYAIEPETVVAWTETQKFNFAFSNFGLGTARVLLELPSKEKWNELVDEAAAAEGLSPVQWTRLTELQAYLTERFARRRSAYYDEQVVWLENAESEYARRSFAAIVAKVNPRKHAHVIQNEYIGDRKDPRWVRPRAATPKREASELAGAVSAMLQNADYIHFVDKHFGPENLRHRKVMEAYFNAMMAGRTVPPRTVALHCVYKGGYDLQSFNGEAQKLIRYLPKGAKLQFYRWRDKEDGEVREKFHNRYLLTDLGGVTFGVGHEDGDDGESEDINLMDRDQYIKRWEQFLGPQTVFDIKDKPATITGTRTP